MSAITIAVLLFSLVGAADYIIGNTIGVGKEFEKAFSLFLPLATNALTFGVMDKMDKKGTVRNSAFALHCIKKGI